MGLIQSRVPEELKQAFKESCTAQNTTEAKMLRYLIEQYLNTQNNDIKKTEKALKTNQVKIRLSDKMISKLDVNLSIEGYETRTEWVTSRVLSSLNKSPVCTKNEQILLRESNRELSAIGRNLNQIARKMN